MSSLHLTQFKKQETSSRVVFAMRMEIMNRKSNLSHWKSSWRSPSLFLLWTGGWTPQENLETLLRQEGTSSSYGYIKVSCEEKSRAWIKCERPTCWGTSRAGTRGNRRRVGPPGSGCEQRRWFQGCGVWCAAWLWSQSCLSRGQSLGSLPDPGDCGRSVLYAAGRLK